jgi:hypothetical protein
VYPINAAYMGPLTLYLYFKFGRAANDSWRLPSSKSRAEKHAHRSTKETDVEDHSPTDPPMQHADMGRDEVSQKALGHDASAVNAHHMDHQHEAPMHMQDGAPHNGHSMPDMAHHGHNMIHMMDDRPFWATVLIGVSHCGAGCVLGDLVGEWLVYGANPMIRGQNIWPELLIDYGFALLFGIVFQYFSIAPMSGQYGPKTLIRAAKADILSLTAFEVGLFGWMVAYQVGIWGYRLEMNTWTYWWMMQVGMILGFITSTPINWYLLKWGIKEPCA